jgi:beta-lactamase superfamily II metal-dependent hydrolase
VIEERAAGDAPLRIGDLALTPLWPPRDRGPYGRNDASLVLRVELAGRVVLLPGDVESAGEHALVAEQGALRADILKLAHHGSRTSSSARFLDAVGPAFAVVSAPLRGRFGMPHPEVVARLAERGLAFGWTGRDGALLVGLGPRLDVRAFAAGEPRGQAARGSAACSSLIPTSSSKPAGWTGGPSLPATAPPSR